MNTKRIWATLLVLFTVGPYYPGVWAVDPNVVAVCHPGFEWNLNSLGQDPCRMISVLNAACRGIGLWGVAPLNTSTSYYIPPSKDTPGDLSCKCDTVMYNFYMSCTTCQGASIISWTTWIAQCQTVYVTQYPHDIPYGTAIPRWAFYDVTTLPNTLYDESIVRSVGRDPEAKPKPMSTGSVGTSTSSRSSPSGSGPTQTSDGSGGQTNNKTNIVAIVGGVVGGVVGLIIVAAVVGIYLKRRKQGGGNQPPPQLYPAQDTSGYQEYRKSHPVSPMNYNPSLPTPTGPNPSFNAFYYNPEDPATFPPPMSGGQSSATYINPLSTHGHNRPCRYNGMPEL